MHGSDSASPTFDTVLLDVDGTLIDSTYLHALAWMRAFASHDLHPEWWSVHRTIGMGGDLLVAEVCGSDVEDRLGDTLRDEWSDRYREVLPEVRPFPQVPEFVATLQDRGYAVAVASSGAAEFTDAALALLDLSRDDFAAVVTAGDVDHAKPAPDVLSVALERAGGTGAVLIGDTVWDVESAKRLSMPTVAVRSGGFGTAELLDAGASLVVDDVAELCSRGWPGTDR